MRSRGSGALSGAPRWGPGSCGSPLMLKRDVLLAHMGSCGGFKAQVLLGTDESQRGAAPAGVSPTWRGYVAVAEVVATVCPFTPQPAPATAVRRLSVALGSLPRFVPYRARPLWWM
jgi:hypothetical protein